MGDENDKGDEKNKTAKEWVNSDKSTEDLVKDSFEAGDADKDWDDRPGK